MRNLFRDIRRLIFAVAVFVGAVSCVDENKLLGSGIVPRMETFITRSASVPISEVFLSTVDSLSGYNQYRMVIGSITDDTFGTVRHGSCISLVPISDTVRWGHNVRVRYFHFATNLDTISYLGAENASIIQHLRVYPMTRPLDDNLLYSCQLSRKDFESQPIISKGTPTYNGGDTLSFDFTDEFARSYIPADALSGDNDVVKIYTADSIDVYKKEHKGFFICTDDNYGAGGRVSMFHLPMQFDNNGYVIGNYAALHITADYGTRKDVDTTILFCFTPTAFNDQGEYYAFNTCETEYIPGKEYGEPIKIYGKDAFKATDRMHVEGGVGFKPFIRASHLRKIVVDSVIDTLRKYGYDTVDFKTQFEHIIINKATLSIFYDVPSDYDRLNYYPQVMNPTLRINNEKKDTVVYGSLTDASITSENQGAVDRYNCCYKPDITHHLQKILSSSEPDDSKEMTQMDIWFLILANETVPVKSSSSSDADYYYQMAYLNYYNSLMNGGGMNTYSNYYNYYMMQSYYDSMSNGDQTATVQLLDTDRYYNAVLRGPKAGERAPKLEIVYSFLRTD